MTKDEALRLALEALENITSVSICEATHHAKKDRHLLCEECPNEVRHLKTITAIKAALANEALERKAENARELGLDYEPYGFEASMYSNDRMKVDSVTGNVSIGTVKKPCGLECDCTDVCKQDDYKALWQQMCERCDELDKKLAQQEHEPVALKWNQAPVKTSWGDGMVVADIAIDKDHTASIYCERDQTAKVEAMFTQPQQEAKDEPVAWRDAAIRLGEELSSVGPDGYYDMDAKEWLDWAMEQNPRGKHSLPQRTWVGLTDEDLFSIYNQTHWNVNEDWNYERAIEAKLKQKNFKE